MLAMMLENREWPKSFHKTHLQDPSIRRRCWGNPRRFLLAHVRVEIGANCTKQDSRFRMGEDSVSSLFAAALAHCDTFMHVDKAQADASFENTIQENGTAKF